jgi:hypothetical protein
LVNGVEVGVGVGVEVEDYSDIILLNIIVKKLIELYTSSKSS